MNISTKLTAAFAFVALLVAGVAYTAINNTKNIDHQYIALADETIPVIQSLEELRFAGLSIVSSVSEFGFIRAEKAAAGLLTAGEEGEEEEEDLIRSGVASYETALAQYEKLVIMYFPGKAEFLQNIETSGAALQEGAFTLVQSKKEGVSGHEILELKEEFEMLEKAFLSAVNVAIAYENVQLSGRKAAVSVATKDGARNILVVTIITFFSSVGVGLFLSRHISETRRLW